MEEGKKKTIMIAIIVVCLVLAVAITLMTGSKKSGIEDIDRGDLWLFKCTNPDCGAMSQMDKKDYFIYISENRKPGTLAVPALVCKECGEESVYKVIKCASCGHVFFPGTVRDDFEDRCPECSYSKIEDERKKAASR